MNRKKLKIVWERTQVECYKANERPVAFFYKEHWWQVIDIVDRWYEGGLDCSRPALYYFKVQTPAGQHFLLRYDPLFEKWFLHDPTCM